VTLRNDIDNSALIFEIGTPTVVERMRFTAAGFLGIGTQTPDAQLDVEDASAPEIRVTNTGSSYSALRQLDAGGALVLNDAAGNERTVLRSYGDTSFVGGDVGIGTTDPIYNLDVSTTGNSKVRINANDAVNDRFPELELRSGNTTAGAYSIIRFSRNGGAIGESLRFLNGAGGTALIIDAAGNGTFAGTVNAKYQDVAEWVAATGELAPGTVVVLDPSLTNTVKASAEPYDTRVAGVVSTQPGLALGEDGPSKVLVATTGRVRVRVDASNGAIAVGDLLVTSDKPGVAMKSEPMELRGRHFHQPGTIVGKALQPLKEGRGEILVLLSLQ
jgi:hypothetical protein